MLSQVNLNEALYVQTGVNIGFSAVQLGYLVFIYRTKRDIYLYQLFQERSQQGYLFVCLRFTRKIFFG